MRPLAWLVASLLALHPRLAVSADQPPEPPPTQFTTTAQGTVPDLAGRWLVVGYVGLQNDPGGVPISLAWEITQSGGTPNVVARYGGLPPDMKAAYDAAAAQRTPWEPTEQQLHALRDGWDTLQPDRPPVASIETTISGPDAPGDLVKTEPTMQDALFAIAMVINFAPGPDRPTKDVMVFGAKEKTDDGYRGTYAGVTLANAPFPIPIAFKGTFRMYRLGPALQASWWRRVLAMFKGCGRTKGN